MWIESKRFQARRSPSGAADKVRIDYQSESRQADRPENSAECAGESGQGDPINEDAGTRQQAIVREATFVALPFSPWSLRFLRVRSGATVGQSPEDRIFICELSFYSSGIAGRIQAGLTRSRLRAGTERGP